MSVGTVAEREVTRRNDVVAKVDAEVVRRAKIVASYKDMSLAEYISEALRLIVDRDLDAEQEKDRKARHAKDKGSKNA